jgi:hypothetical protein
MQGEYIAGVQSGKWTWWREDGSVMRVEEYGAQAWTEEGLPDDIETEMETETAVEETEEDAPEIGTLRTPTFE